MGFIEGEKKIQEVNKIEHWKDLTKLVSEVTEEQMLLNLTAWHNKADAWDGRRLWSYISDGTGCCMHSHQNY